MTKTLNILKQIVFWLAAVLTVLGAMSNFVRIPVVSDWSWQLVVRGFVLLALSNLLEVAQR